MKETRIGYANLIITVILFSTFEAVSKTLVGKIDPFQINFYRFLLGGVILFIFLLINKDFKIDKHGILWCGLLGLINVALSMNFLQISLAFPGAKASIVASIFSSNPIFVFIFSALIDKEKVSLKKIMGFIIGMLGIAVIFMQKIDVSSLDYRSPFLALLSAVFYGLYTVLGRKVSLRVGSLKMNSYSFMLGSLMVLPMLVCFNIPITGFDYSGIPQLLYIVVFVTGVAYLTYFKGLSIVGASSGSLVFFLKPALASAIAIIFLKEELTVNLLLGTGLIICGIVVGVYNKKVQSQNKE